MKSLLLFCLSLILAVSLCAQEECPCCSETNRQFDFWVGDWLVLDSAGTKLGENKIIKIEGGCILSENWKGAMGGTGSSYNYYDRSDSTWNQLWIDNSGNILKLKGQFQSGQMVMKSELQKGSRLDWYYNQNEKLLQTAFLGIYLRKE